METPLLSVRDLSVEFGPEGRAKTAIDRISFDVPQGECLGIIGESGSGKSATALAVLGLLPRQARMRGAVSFDGRDLAALSEAAMRQVRGCEIGFVFQDPMTTLHPMHRIGRQIGEAIRVHDPRISKRALRERVLSVMEEVAIPERKRRFDQFPHELSGGLRQRVCIAIAIANAPRLLIADEPTTALDVTVQRRLIETLQDLVAQRRMSMMLISHDLAVVHDLAQRVEIFLDGRIVEGGPIERVVSAPKEPYTRLLIDAVPTLDLERRRIAGRSGATTGDAPRIEHLHAPDAAPSALLAIDNVSKYYGNLPVSEQSNTEHPAFAVRNVTLDIIEGECHAIVGESGCGKSTLLKCIAGVLPVSAGSIRYQGQTIGARRGELPFGFREDMQMVFQDPYSSLHPRMRVFDIIAEPLRNLRVPKSQIAERVAVAMNAAQVDESAAPKFPFQFSGGQRQRIGIARALVTRPRFLILDEPVSALDVSVQADVLNLLNEIRQTLGLTYVFISHDLGVVNYVADRISVMKDGRIVETGNRTDVLEAPKHAFTQLLLDASPGKSFHDHLARDRAHATV